MLSYGARAVIVWVIGLVTAVPLAVYYLLFHAPREQYVLLIPFIVGWVFFYWPIIGPILSLLKLRAVYRGLRQIRSVNDLRRRLLEGEGESVLIDWIAQEYHIPKFLARRAYRRVLRLVAASDRLNPSPSEEQASAPDRIMVNSGT